MLSVSLSWENQTIFDLSQHTRISRRSQVVSVLTRITDLVSQVSSFGLDISTVRYIFWLANNFIVHFQHSVFWFTTNTTGKVVLNLHTLTEVFSTHSSIFGRSVSLLATVLTEDQTLIGTVWNWDHFANSVVVIEFVVGVTLETLNGIVRLSVTGLHVENILTVEDGS